MRSSLDTIAHAVSGGVRDALSFPWAILRYSHTATRESGLTVAVRVSGYAPRHLLQGHARSAPRDRVADAGQLRELPQRERARHLTLQAIADRLDPFGVPIVNGGQCWHDNTVHYGLSPRVGKVRGGGTQPPS